MPVPEDFVQVQAECVNEQDQSSERYSFPVCVAPHKQLDLIGRLFAFTLTKTFPEETLGYVSISIFYEGERIAEWYAPCGDFTFSTFIFHMILMCCKEDLR